MSRISKNRLLKNTHLLRYAHHSSLRRTKKYASFLMISRALHLRIFEQPGLGESAGCAVRTAGACVAIKKRHVILGPSLHSG